MIRRAAAAALACFLVATAPLGAQDSVIVIDPDLPADSIGGLGPPPEVVRELLSAFNDSATTRITGNFALPSGSRIQANLGVYRGVLRIAGHVSGAITVVNGDVLVLAGGTIEGSVLVVGGRLQVEPGGVHTGRRRVYQQIAPVYRTTTGLLAMRPPRRTLGDLASAQASFQTGKIRTTLFLETGRTYNRIEGLPIIVGPAFFLPTTGGTEGRLDARAIFRTAGDQTKLRDEFGFLVRSEWQFPGTIKGGIGGRWYSVIESIEEHPLSRSESGWAAFLLARDYRDYYEARGTGVYGWLHPVPELRLEGSWRRDRERSVRAADPVRVLRRDEPWRPNPLVDDGHYRTLGLHVDFDTRNNAAAPTAGWLVHAKLEQSRSEDAQPVALPTEVREPIPSFRPYRFGVLSFDARRYTRFGPSSRVNLRVVGSGWIGGDPLPVQRRVSLGGPDLLPGYGFRALTCAPPSFGDAARAALCDRMLASQLEVRTRVNLGLSSLLPDQDFYGLDQLLNLEQADLVLFGSAGTAWLAGDGPGRVPSSRIPVFGEWKKDVGVGLDTGTFALYLAKAIGEAEPIRLTVRLERRF